MCNLYFIEFYTGERKDSRTKSISKIKLGNIMNNVRKVGVTRRESVTHERQDSLSKSTSPSSSSIGAPATTQSSASPSTRKSSDKDKKKPTGLASFKAKTGLLGGKNKKSKVEKEIESSGGKELKHRLFFREKVEPSDEEILDAIGAEQSVKVVSQSINEIANAATFMKKFLDGKKPPTPGASGFPSSVLYVGSLKARLSRTGDDLINNETGAKASEAARFSKNSAMSSTVFLGKMISRKDKHGLIRGGSDNSDEEVESFKDNPVFVALEKVKLKAQMSVESDSRAHSRASNARY